MKYDESKLEMLIDSHHGVYIPQIFAQYFEEQVRKHDPEIADILLSGPDHEDYWESWAQLIDYSDFVLINDKGERYTVTQNEDVWAYPEDMEIPENFWI